MVLTLAFWVYFVDAVVLNDNKLYLNVRLDSKYLTRFFYSSIELIAEVVRP